MGKAPRRTKAKPAPEPVGALTMRVVTDVREAMQQGARYQIAYARLTKAIDQLKGREPYLGLERDLVALLQPPVEG